jgi:adenylate cyclase
MITIEYSYLLAAPKKFETGVDTVVIGRPSGDWAVDLDLSPDNTVSRRHARLTFENGAYWIEDISSRGGTWVNGLRISSKVRLNPGDHIKIGQTDLFLPDKTPQAVGRLTKLNQTRPIRRGQIDEISEKGILTTTVSARESPTNLLMVKASGKALDIVQRRLSAFYELGAALGAMQSVESLLKTVVEHLCRVISGGQRGALLLLNGRKLTLKAYAPAGSKPSVSLYLAQLAIERQEAFTWRYGAAGEMGKLTDSIVSHGTRCAMYAPLIWQGEVLGIICVDNYIVEDAFTSDDLRLLMAMASQAAMFVKNHNLQERLLHETVVRSNLLRQFSPHVATHLEKLLRQPEGLGLGGERVEPVTILNSDVRGFTTLSAQMEPKEVMEMLNQLFGVCIPIIFKYNGSVDKYIGDGILAVFGSPNPDPKGDQWVNAVRAGLEMQQAVRKLGREWAGMGRPVYEIGIGIHTGAVLQGFIGSEEQMEYTVIGDTVNRASRYCDGAGKGEVVISPAVYGYVAGLVEVAHKMIKTKHSDTEADLEAYLVKGFSTQILG